MYLLLIQEQRLLLKWQQPFAFCRGSQPSRETYTPLYSGEKQLRERYIDSGDKQLREKYIDNGEKRLWDKGEVIAGEITEG